MAVTFESLATVSTIGCSSNLTLWPAAGQIALYANQFAIKFVVGLSKLEGICKFAHQISSMLVVDVA